MQRWGDILVKDWGDARSRLILVGEAPGNSEVGQGKPFVGESGLLLEKWWKEVGLIREHFYITNVFPYQPWKNDIMTNVPEDVLKWWGEQLHERLALLEDPWIIVPTGNVALRTLLRTERVKVKDPAINDWRGSILIYTDNRGRKIKMIPTLHPANSLYMKSMELRSVKDWERIRRECTFKEVVKKERAYVINPTIDEVKEYFERLEGHEGNVAVDIETHPQQGITCVGFAADDDYSFTVPFEQRKTIRIPAKKKGVSKEDKEKWEKEMAGHVVNALADVEGLYPLLPNKKKGGITKAAENAINKFRETEKATPALMKAAMKWCEEKGIEVREKPSPREFDFITVGYWKEEWEDEEAKHYVKKFILSATPKIFQNGLYDTFWFKNWLGVEVNRWDWDTMYMHHAFSPRDSHSLDYMASIFTDEPFWKKEAKQAEESGKLAKRRDALYTYNGKDCCVTKELCDKFLAHIQERDLGDFYHNHYRLMQQPLLSIMSTGIPVDMEAVEEERKKAQTLVDEGLKEIEEKTGKDLRGKKKISGTKLKNYLYDELKLPIKKAKRAKGEKTATADANAIRQLTLQGMRAVEKNPTSRQAENFRTFLDVAPRILEVNRQAKVLEQLLPHRFDADARMRSSYNFTTTTGRLNSSSNPFGTGSNAQNIDRGLRHIFRAGEGKLFMEIDLSQVEGRIVYMLTRDSDLVQMARTHPADYDMHTAEAAVLFNVGESAVTSAQRYLGKRTVHAAQRGMMGKTLSEKLLEEDELKSPEECQELIEAYFRGKPSIREVYFREVRDKIWNQKKLSTIWGREIHFPYDRWKDELYREGYSFEPQSTAGDLLNQWGLIPTHRYIVENKLKTRIIAQVHDALWFEADPHEAWYVAECMRWHIERPLIFPAGELVVPCTLKIGKTAKGDFEWKRFPSLEEFNEKVKEILND